MTPSAELRGPGGAGGAAAPSVSVLVPLYNGRPWIAGALESLQAQSLADFEALIVDDGSEDGSEEAVRPFLSDPRFRFERRPHAGVAAARNRALASARGGLIAFLDQDDLCLPDKLRLLSDALRAAPEAGLAYGGLERMDAEGRPLGRRELPAPREGRLLEVFLEAGTAIPLLSLLARRSVFEAAGGFDETLFGADDHDWLLRAAEAARFVRVDAVVARQRYRPGTAGQTEPMHLDRLKMAAKLRRRWPERARQLDRWEARARYRYGSWLLAGGRGPEARPQFAAALGLRPADWRAAAKWVLSWR